jgi:hypothetical protein
MTYWFSLFHLTLFSGKIGVTSSSAYDNAQANREHLSGVIFPNYFSILGIPFGIAW